MHAAKSHERRFARLTFLPAFFIAIAVVAFVSVSAGGVTGGGSTTPTPQLRASGNELARADDSRVVLHGVDRAGTESDCVQGRGIFTGPTDQASVDAMKSWGINAVRLPLNEACWNGQSYVNPAYSGAKYRAAISAYVRLLNANGIFVVLDLHWTDGQYEGYANACKSAEATCQKPMPDAAESVPFWSSVAETFKNNNDVIFDLFNEPYPDLAIDDESKAWECWRNGGSYCSPGISYTVAGMQTLVDAVRGAGAGNVVMLGGLNYSSNLSQWLHYEPTDPDHNLVASWHSYSFSSCNDSKCWSTEIGSVSSFVPVISGEIGEDDCTDNYINSLMRYLDSKSVSYMAYSWNASPVCSKGMEQGLGLISNYSGTPNAYGAGYKSHLTSLARS